MAPFVSEPIRIFVVDDHAAIREGIQRLLHDQQSMLWVGDAGSVAEAQAKLMATAVDVALLDVHLPDGSGLDLCQWLLAHQRAQHVLLLTGSMHEQTAVSAIERGASGLLYKNARGRDIMAALRTVAQGGSVWDRHTLQRVIVYCREAHSTQAADSFADRLKELYEGIITLTDVAVADDLLPHITALNRRITRAQYGALAVLNADNSIAQFITDGLDPDEVRRIGPLPRGRGLLGEVIRQRRPVRVGRIDQHPASCGWPAHHPPMTSFLGVPMIFRGQVMGHLYVTNKVDGEFSQEDEELSGLLASLAAVLIHNRHLKHDVEKLAVVAERERIGMNLHDGTLQTLYAVLLGLDAVLEELPDDMADVYHQLNTLADRLQKTTQDIRNYILNLKQESVNLLEATERLVTELGLQHQVHLHTADDAYSALSAEQVEHIVRFTQEALSNAARHAHATRIDVTWRSLGDSFQWVIEDDGVGFDPNAPSPTGHYGRLHLTQRAEFLGGQLHVHSRPHEGTRLELTAPWSKTLTAIPKDRELHELAGHEIIGPDPSN